MTRDQWLRQCAQRFIDRSDLDQDEVAAYAVECAKVQAAENGPTPVYWDSPIEAADDEMSYWDNDGEDDDGEDDDG